MKKLLLILLLAFLVTSSQAQPTAELDRFCEKTIHKQWIYSDRADNLAQQLIYAYNQGGEDAVDDVLATSDDTWYSALDLYMADNATAIISAMTNDQQASYRDTSIKKATVEVAYDGANYMVIIFSYIP